MPSFFGFPSAGSPAFRAAAACLLALQLAGCAGLVSGFAAGMADNLAVSILDSEDIDTVREGAPAYLLLIDSFLQGSPDSEDLLLAAAELNGAFAVLVEGDEARVKLLAGKAMDYAERAACVAGSLVCGAREMTWAGFEEAVAALKKGDLDIAYGLGVAWVGRLQANSDDWVVIAELGRARLLMERVLELDETWEDGGAHLYLGGMETLLPASLGGRPDKGRMHFERALALNDEWLMTKVIYAQQYARLVFDRALHDRLLNDVISADPRGRGMTLTNRIAQEQAKELLATAADYFQD